MWRVAGRFGKKNRDVFGIQISFQFAVNDINGKIQVFQGMMVLLLANLDSPFDVRVEILQDLFKFGEVPVRIQENVRCI